MMRMMRILSVVMLVVSMATTVGYAQCCAMTPEQMNMMGAQTKLMGDQMKSGQMTADQMKMMAEHMQMMADRMKEGQMAPDQMKMMNDHMQMMRGKMKME